MKLSELRACDGCGGAIAPTFFRVSVEHHAVRPAAVDALLGTGRILGGSPAAMAIASALTGDPTDATVAVTAARDLLLCCECYCGGSKIVQVAENRAKVTPEAQKQIDARERAGAVP